jgi:hypothetical protein
MAAKLTKLTHEIGDTTAPSGREPYHLQFSLQFASLETFGYTLVQYFAVPARTEQVPNYLADFSEIRFVVPFV